MCDETTRSDPGAGEPASAGQSGETIVASNPRETPAKAVLTQVARELSRWENEGGRVDA
jgi:hypothetical protein